MLQRLRNTEKGCDSINTESNIKNLPNVNVKLGNLVQGNCGAKHLSKKSSDLVIGGKVSHYQLIQRPDLLLKQHLILKLIVFIAKTIILITSKLT